MTREELLSRITTREFYEWMLLEQVEPFGEYAQWIRTGTLTASMVNIFIDRKKQRPFKPMDFVPDYTKDHTPKEYGTQSIEEQTAMMFALMGAQAKRASS